MTKAKKRKMIQAISGTLATVALVILGGVIGVSYESGRQTSVIATNTNNIAINTANFKAGLAEIKQDFRLGFNDVKLDLREARKRDDEMLRIILKKMK